MKLNHSSLAWLGAAVVMIVAGAVLFGAAGARTIAGMVVFFVLPVFLLLQKTALDVEEKVFFSLFTGLGLFSLLVWVLNRALPSFRLSIVAALALVGALFFLGPKFLARKARKAPQAPQ